MAACISVDLRVFVPAPIRHGWHYVPWTLQDPVAVERLNTLYELPRLLRAYGRAAAPMVHLSTGDRFAITAYGSRSRRAYGRDVWLWDTELKIFRAHGDPWVPGIDVARLVVQRATALLPVETAA